MAKGVSLHMGLNKVDPQHYGSDHPLNAAVADAKSMKIIADNQGYDSTILLNEAATTANFIQFLVEQSKVLEASDILFITYAGHGANIYDETGDEPDGLDETWVMYDRMLIDDETFSLLKLFKPGVRILFITDSCQNATVVRLFSPNPSDYNARAIGELGDENIGFRFIDDETARNVVEKHSDTYKLAKYMAYRGDTDAPRASVELLSACQDDQYAADGTRNGYFTSCLLKVWDDGKFDKNYPSFFTQIKQSMRRPSQVPNRLSLGPPHPKFQFGKPFEI